VKLCFGSRLELDRIVEQLDAARANVSAPLASTTGAASAIRRS